MQKQCSHCALRGLDSRRSGRTETDDEWAALEQLLAERALRPEVTEHLTHPRTLRKYAKRVTQALVKAQHTAAKMIYMRHSSRHKHLLLHRQQAEEEAAAVHKQRVANKTDYQAVAGVLMSLQRQVRASVPPWLFCSILYSSMLQCYIASIRCYSTI